jgi:hypothetical protein
VTEDDRLTLAPILVVDADIIRGFDRAHGRGSFREVAKTRLR